ncbi:hypothetical protein VCHA29O37_40036 [Vibrio chagasii]|nr:hypothetical protein VCHA29O37_40036 [Vibrio chagasii]
MIKLAFKAVKRSKKCMVYNKLIVDMNVNHVFDRFDRSL